MTRPSAIPPRDLDPTPVTRLATAFWGSMCLLTANRLELFTFLADAAHSVEELAALTGSDRAALTLLLNACVGLGLVEREGDRYRNVELAASFLVRGGPAFLGDALRYSADLYPVWGRLPEAVASGRSPVSPAAILGENPEQTRHFVLAMHDRASGIARTLAEQIDLSGRRHLLDLGAGPGTYSLLLLGKTPGLRATLCDHPGVLSVAHEIVARYGGAERVDYLPGDYHQVDFGAAHDVVLMSGMLHRESPEGCRSLLRRSFAALPPGGLVLASDVFFDDSSRTSPPFAALFALNMLLTAGSGQLQVVSELKAWMQEAGFIRVATRRLPPPLPYLLIEAHKPD